MIEQNVDGHHHVVRGRHHRVHQNHGLVLNVIGQLGIIQLCVPKTRELSSYQLRDELYILAVLQSSLATVE